MKNIVQASMIVTYRCNAKCQMCEIWKHPSKPQEEIGPEICEKIPSGLRINITGGEPTVRDDIEEFFKILYPKSYLLELSTNGYYTDKIVHLAEKYPNILIRVSVEGLPALNDKLRGIPNGFDHALRTILELKKTKCKNIGFSIVVSPQNVKDLISLYELCCYLEVELGNSVIHNSWYFHKYDNKISGENKEWETVAEFIKCLLKSRRRKLKDKLKDYARAYFAQSILKRIRGDVPGYRPPCGAGKDFFFIDPYGNVTPCNGSDEEWIVGNLKDDSLENIFNSDKFKQVMMKVQQCNKECCFVVTERHDMVRRPWKPISWIIKNKIKLMFNLPIEL
jgi:MoaA/NifB/PqqE/SkfB family radical SAM enzyme